MVWPFSKPSVSKPEFRELINTIKKSFSNVKTDISKIKERTSSSEDEIKELHNIIGYLNRSTQILNTKIDSLIIQEKPVRQRRVRNVEEDTEEIPESSSLKDKSQAAQRLWDNLTNVQRSLVINLSSILNEEGKDWIPMKYLSQELYPDKDYSDIKAMISNYTDVLDEQGFIQKKRKRRETFLALADKSHSFIPKKEISIRKK